MKKYTVKIDGMMCGMCEAHINDAIRAAFPDVKKVKASHGKGTANFISEEIDENRLREVIDATGYTFVSAESEEYVKKGLFW
jgi:copper chaperone CopZ